MQEPPGTIPKCQPRVIQRFRSVMRLFIERLGTTGWVDLDKLHDSIHPWRHGIWQWGSPECDDDLSTASVDLPAPDLHDFADRNRFVAAKIEYSFQNEIRVQTRGAEGGCITGLEREGQQSAGVERSVMIGITRQDEAMSQGFKVLRLGLWHQRRVPGTCLEREMSHLRSRKTYHGTGRPQRAEVNGADAGDRARSETSGFGLADRIELARRSEENRDS